MMRCCPACNLPTEPNSIGIVFAATSNDQTAHGVVALCRRCAAAGQRLPPAIRLKTANRAADRALANPDAYLCTVYPTIATARLATAMLGHPQHALETLGALGWLDGTDQ
jgi:hypothetical protein